jgi:hypothetical protein
LAAEAEEMPGKCDSVTPARIPYTFAKLGSEMYVHYRTLHERLSFFYEINNRE